LVGCCVNNHRFAAAEGQSPTHLSISFVVPFSRPKQWDNAPPRDPTRSPLIFTVPFIAAADGQLEQLNPYGRICAPTY
jgi:hypothetical protein